MTESEAWGGPIVTRHIADDVQDRLVTAVALGVYVPGQQLPTERELSAMLGVSRNSVRGALKELTETGYLEVRRGRNGGYFVLADWVPARPSTCTDSWCSTGPSSRHCSTRARCSSPSSPVPRPNAAPPTTPHAIEAALGAYLDAPDHDASRQADYALHHAIASATRNPILVEMSIDLRARIGLNLGAEPYTRRSGSKRSSSTNELVVAVTTGRADEAADLAADHFTLSEGLIRRLVQRAKTQQERGREETSAHGNTGGKSR